MNEDSMTNSQNMPKTGTPLSVFQNELSKLHGENKRKKFLYVILPLILVVLIVGGYLVYRNIKIQKEKAILNENLTRNLQTNQKALDEIESGEAEPVPNSLVRSANKLIESAKLDPNNGLNQEQLDALKERLRNQ